ncbi:MAG: glycosyl transferase family 2 [Pseudopedobacter saltans]|uniref:Glycosyl transferase family 2 n=1 Tax=Pseudopedobacter saltans TaxID=151895 RepID=A0A2W5F670_9SPHI|nr:MAG: glycosyl transferase family 2 [Pseudopedobacter saltans]
MRVNGPSVGVVILNYNGRNFLERFLPSVLKSTYTSMVVYVADNGSTDDSLSWLSTSHPEIGLIKISENYGFAEGYNIALKEVNTDYYVLLNSDVEVTPNWIEPIIELMESNTTIGICQPKLLSFADNSSLEYAGAAGGWVDVFGYPFCRGRLFDTVEKDDGQYNDNVPVFWATGAALFIKRAVWETVGGFDGYLFAHQEEIDLCWRTQLAGYQVYYCHESVVYHVGGGTLNKSNPRKTYLNFRNSLMILAKNLPKGQAFIKILCRLCLDGIFGVKLFLSGSFKDVWAVIKAHFGFYRWLLSSKSKHRFPKKKLQELQGTVNQSIVWQYFIKKKKTFSEIVHKK